MQDDIKELKTMVRSVINGQSAMKAELIKEIKKVDNKIEKHREETKKGFKDTNHRINMLGKQLNTLDEDAPTDKDFTNLVERVTTLENNNFITA